ncbi:MAG TPA: hypothetical protein VFF67_06455 [Thermoplasmata archaeon]|nr:hypothetical protein [Thermoplasmata archaeon]
MDGRVWTGLLGIAVPGVLVAITVWKFAANPLALVALFTAMIVGGIYLLTFSEPVGSA